MAERRAIYVRVNQTNVDDKVAETQEEIDRAIVDLCVDTDAYWMPVHTAMVAVGMVLHFTIIVERATESGFNALEFGR